jgi:hypothetical protein
MELLHQLSIRLHPVSQPFDQCPDGRQPCAES